MRVLILANGEPPSSERLRRLAAESDLFLAADGAAHTAVAGGVAPDIVCGDFDSVRLAVAQAELPQTEFTATPDQDYADLEKALHVARERGGTEFTILGAAGGRIDHTLANIALLLRYHAEFALRLVDDFSEVCVLGGADALPDERAFAVDPGDTISLISFGGTARVTITGVQWPLDDFRLPIGTRGVSNRAESESVTIKVRGGAVIVCRLYAEAPLPNLPPKNRGRE